MNIFFIILGYISIILTSISYLPQIITVIIHKSGKNISYPYLGLIGIELCFYFIYGLGFILDNNLDAIPMIIGSVIQMGLLLTLLVLKILFSCKKKSKHRQMAVSSHAEPTASTNSAEPSNTEDIV